MGRKPKTKSIPVDRTPVIRVKLASHRPAVGPFDDEKTARLFAKNNLPIRFGMTREEAIDQAIEITHRAPKKLQPVGMVEE